MSTLQAQLERMVNAAFPKMAKLMLENIEDDLRAGRINDQGPHREVQEVRADLGRTFRAQKLAGCWWCGDQRHSRRKCH